MKIYTESGSVYEIERKSEGYRVRRLVNGAPAPDNVRASESWRDAESISEPMVGVPLAIGWEWRGNILQSTITSRVTAIFIKSN